MPRIGSAYIVCEGVEKTWGEGTGVSDISLAVEPGQLFGLVGPSGCGKTTLVRIIVGLLAPSAGTVRVAGASPDRFTPADRRQIGYLQQEFSLYPMLTVMQNAKFAAGIYGVGWQQRRTRIREVLTLLDLWDARGRRADAISGGMRRRLGLACALLHEPRLLVVDEPTAGLDPDLRAKIWEYLDTVRARGTTIFLTTQYLDEAERCDAVHILRAGKTLASGSPDELRERAAVPETIDIELDELRPTDTQLLWEMPGVTGVRRMDAHTLQITTADAEHVLPAAMAEFARQGREPKRVDVRRASFENVFQRLVNE